MNGYTVLFPQENKRVVVQKGDTIYSAAVKAGVELTGSCGGQGVCGKCLVELVSGKVTQTERYENESEGSLPRMVLACHSEVESDLIVQLPRSSRLKTGKVLLDSEGSSRIEEENVETAVKNDLEPICYQMILEINPPTLSDNISDYTRLENEIKKETGYEHVKADLSVIQKLAHVLREEWEIVVTVFEEEKDAASCEILDVEPASKNTGYYALAVDIGTTTIAAYLVDMKTGEIIDRKGIHNSQAKFGDDVISRMVYAEENGGLEMLQKSVSASINQLLDMMEESCDFELKREDIKLVFAAGNTIMTHLLCGLDTKFIRREPYIPTANQLPPLEASDIGLDIFPGAKVLTFPSVASYVGGDIVAGVLVNGQTESEKITLYVDIGTNGEIVLGNKDWLVTCACSAGPAFEGGGITCGMRAVEGAIETISINFKDYSVSVNTIGTASPTGICGSGLIDCISELLDAGLIDRGGRLYMDRNLSRVRRRQGEKEFVLVWGSETGDGNDIVITENDIQNILRSKGAVFAGIQSLLKAVELDLSLVEEIVIAGGFGSYLNIENTIKIGLLPDLPRDKYRFIGNGALKGAYSSAVSKAKYIEALESGANMTYIELSNGAGFMDEFVSAMFFPHTDMSLFPSFDNRKESLYG